METVIAFAIGVIVGGICATVWWRTEHADTVKLAFDSHNLVKEAQADSVRSLDMVRELSKALDESSKRVEKLLAINYFDAMHYLKRLSKAGVDVAMETAKEIHNMRQMYGDDYESKINGIILDVTREGYADSR